MQTHVPGTMLEAPSLQGLSGLEKEGGGDSKGPHPPLRSSGSLTGNTDQAQSWKARPQSRPQSRPQAKAARALPAVPAPSRLPGSGLSGDTEAAPPGCLFQAPQTGSPVIRRTSRSAPPAPQSRRRLRSSPRHPGLPRAGHCRGLRGCAPIPRVRRLWHGVPPTPQPAPAPTGGRLDAPDPPGRSPSGPLPARSPAPPQPCRPLPARGAPTVRSGARWAGPGRAGPGARGLSWRRGPAAGNAKRLIQPRERREGARGGGEEAGRRDGGRGGRKTRAGSQCGAGAPRTPAPAGLRPARPSRCGAPPLPPARPATGVRTLLRKRGAGGDWGQPPG